eukprot:9748388-Prorocentrum_lima.AAC.1
MMKVVHLVGYLAEHWVDPWEHQMVDCWAADPLAHHSAVHSAGKKVQRKVGTRGGQKNGPLADNWAGVTVHMWAEMSIGMSADSRIHRTVAQKADHQVVRLEYRSAD